MWFSNVACKVIMPDDLVGCLGWTVGFTPGFCVLSRGRNHTETASGELTQNNSSAQQGHIKLCVAEGGEKGRHVDKEHEGKELEKT